MASFLWRALAEFKVAWPSAIMRPTNCGAYRSTNSSVKDGTKLLGVHFGPLWNFWCLTWQLWGDVAGALRLRSPAEPEAAAGQRGQLLKAPSSSSGLLLWLLQDRRLLRRADRRLCFWVQSTAAPWGDSRAPGAWLSNFFWNNACASTRRLSRSLACPLLISKITGIISFGLSWCVKMPPWFETSGGLLFL